VRRILDEYEPVYETVTIVDVPAVPAWDEEVRDYSLVPNTVAPTPVIDAPTGTPPSDLPVDDVPFSFRESEYI
jgi:hypothetical protein